MKEKLKDLRRFVVTDKGGSRKAGKFFVCSFCERINLYGTNFTHAREIKCE
jgi:hypothetical protein